MSDQPIDQTTFFESAQLRDEEKKTVSPTKKHEEEATDTPKPVRSVKKPPLPLYIAIGVLVLLVLILVAVGGAGNKNQRTRDVSPQATQTPTMGSKLPEELQKTVNTLEEDIKAADPQNNDLPFPPVNFSLHLKSPPLTSN